VLKNAVLESLCHCLRTDWRTRWLIANLLGWTGGLFGGLFLLRVLPGWLGLVLALLLTGGIVGAAQGWALRGFVAIEPCRWVVRTMLGLGLAAPFALLILVPVGAFGLISGDALPGLVAGAVAGGLTGLLLGLAQSRLVIYGDEGQSRWVLVCAGGGALCGLLTLLPILPGLPIGLAAGALIYGWLTVRLIAGSSNEIVNHGPD
jgi:hypothetical protein